MGFPTVSPAQAASEAEEAAAAERRRASVAEEEDDLAAALAESMETVKLEQEAAQNV